MVWYPSVDDVVYANFIVLSLGNDRHPHRLRRSRESIQAVLDHLVQAEGEGNTRQAAMLMKELAKLHAFDGGNHRTAFVLAAVFLKENGRRMRIERFGDAYAFISRIEAKSIPQIQEWIERGSTDQSQ